LVFAIIWIAFFEGGGWPYLSNGTPKCIDFGWMWLSAKFAVTGELARIFDYPAFSHAQTTFFGPLLQNCPNFNRFYYPPTFLFFIYPFGFLRYGIALGVWISILLSLYLVTVYAIIRRRTALILAVAPVFVMLSNIMMGHNGFFTAALIGLSLICLQRRPWLSGIFLGLLTYKPHFGLLFPIALLSSRNWRAIGSTIVTTIVLGVLAAMAFGYEGWSAFIESLTDRNASLGPAPWVEPRLQSVFGLFDWFGASREISWIMQVTAAVIVAFGIWVLWSKPASHNLKAAALCAGTLLVSPYALFYDLTIPAIAAAFFVKEGLSGSFLPGERTAILICWILLLFMWMRSGPVICAVLLFLIARRLVMSRKGPFVRRLRLTSFETPIMPREA
jgi:arabinofuranan 3-O-arabinosyltransferase